MVPVISEGQPDRTPLWGVWTGVLYGACIPVWFQVIKAVQRKVLCLGLPR